LHSYCISLALAGLHDIKLLLVSEWCSWLNAGNEAGLLWFERLIETRLVWE
jgi:hypothetical protein